MRNERVFYKHCGSNNYQRIEFNSLQPGDVFIIKDYPDDETAFEKGDRIFKALENTYKNENGIGTINVDIVGRVVGKANLIE